MMRILAWLAAGLGLAALGGVVVAAQYREQIEEPAHIVVAAADGFELRDYKPMIVAEVTIEASQMRARRAGFQRLAAYIFAQDRPGVEKGEKIAMTSPVMQDQSEKIAMTSPVMQDNAAADGADGTQSANGPWRTRFVMPSKYTLETLPEAPADITLTEIPGRRVAVIMFSGVGRPDDLATMEAKLREWMEAKEYEAGSAAEYAFYDGPWVPARFRRNEVLIPLVKAK